MIYVVQFNDIRFKNLLDGATFKAPFIFGSPLLYFFHVSLGKLFFSTFHNSNVVVHFLCDLEDYNCCDILL